jgi:hypothetical protein
MAAVGAVVALGLPARRTAGLVLPVGRPVLETEGAA